MSETITFHYPPDLLQVLIEAVPNLTRTKRDLMNFYLGAGVPSEVLSEYWNQLNDQADTFKKLPVTRQILTRLNQRQDNEALRARREIIRRVVGWEDFSTCYPDKRDAAEANVARIRHIVNVNDTFTKIEDERQRERSERIKKAEKEAETARKNHEKLAQVKKQLYSLFALQNAQQRGKALEAALNALFQIEGILIKEAFELRSADEHVIEQIDGVIAFDSHLYLVEMKWHKENLGPDKTAQHIVRVFNRGEVRGILISATPPTEAAIMQFKDALRNNVLCVMELSEIVEALEKQISIGAVLKKKVEAAQLHKNPFHKPIGTEL